MKNRRLTVYTAIIMIIVAVVGFSVFNVLSVRKELADQLAQQASYQKEKDKLSEELSNVENPEYIEEQARSVLKMVRPGEILYVLPQHGTSDPAVVAVPSDSPAGGEGGPTGKNAGSGQ